MEADEGKEDNEEGRLMGTSTGVEFLSNLEDKPLHWETRGERIVLWVHDETVKILDLDWDEAVKCAHDLQILIDILNGDSK
jgi:hypothetical protein